MTITVCSIFRNSTPYLDRYFAQIEGLRAAGDVQLALAEGDSDDGTFEAIEGRLQPGDFLAKIDHGGPVFGSVDAEQRWAQIALVVSGLIGKIGDPGAALIWVESDLIWKPEALTALIGDLRFVPAVAPMVFHGDSARFYDIWGYRREGQCFSPYPPYWTGAHTGAHNMVTNIDSCGSCFALAPEAYPSLFSWDGRWPFTAGGDLWIDPRVEVIHP